MRVAYVAIEAWRVEMLAGDVVAAEAELRRGHDLLVSVGEKYLLSTVAGLLAQTLYILERFDEAVPLGQLARELASEDDVDTQALWRCVQAKLLAREGDFEQAELLVREALEILGSTDAALFTSEPCSTSPRFSVSRATRSLGSTLRGGATTRRRRGARSWSATPNGCWPPQRPVIRPRRLAEVPPSVRRRLDDDGRDALVRLILDVDDVWVVTLARRDEDAVVVDVVDRIRKRRVVEDERERRERREDERRLVARGERRRNADVRGLGGGARVGLRPRDLRDRRDETAVRRQARHADARREPVARAHVLIRRERGRGRIGACGDGVRRCPRRVVPRQELGRDRPHGVGTKARAPAGAGQHAARRGRATRRGAGRGRLPRDRHGRGLIRVELRHDVADELGRRDLTTAARALEHGLLRLSVDDRGRDRVVERDVPEDRDPVVRDAGDVRRVLAVRHRAEPRLVVEADRWRRTGGGRRRRRPEQHDRRQPSSPQRPPQDVPIPGFSPQLSPHS